MEETEEKLKSLLMKVKEESEKADSNLIQKMKGTKKPLDESEREEWKSWLKTQHSKN